MNIQEVIDSIRNVPDFPIPGIQFKDITTAFNKPEILAYLIDQISEQYSDKQIDKVVAIESRGFILGGAIANNIGAGFVPIRKPGKLPADVFTQEYELEYGTDSIEVHKDAIKIGENILIHDDLLATGGTAGAACELVKKFHPGNIYLNFVIELEFLNGRETLKDYPCTSLVKYQNELVNQDEK
ncbi:MAG: adenine phosphoribosyltransferase [Bacteroidales bacterium]|nr:adenine phosphoribosyltransferase [Bacteroidales bacterium]